MVELAQLVECLTAEWEVTSSIPGVGPILIALGSKPPLVTRIARTSLGTRLGSHTVFSRHLKSVELSDLGFELLMQISWLHIECTAS